MTAIINALNIQGRGGGQFYLFTNYLIWAFYSTYTKRLVLDLYVVLLLVFESGM